MLALDSARGGFPGDDVAELVLAGLDAGAVLAPFLVDLVAVCARSAPE
ncbi:hypothetical protein [Streptosporangium vulgare]